MANTASKHGEVVMSKFKRKMQRDKTSFWKKSPRKRNRTLKQYEAYMESLPDDDPKKIEYMNKKNLEKGRK